MKEEMINVKVKYCRENLICELESLIQNCQYEVERLKNDDNYKPNSLGIIQGNSIDIDCARLYALYEMKDLID